jgi:hypothetical protein
VLRELPFGHVHPAVELMKGCRVKIRGMVCEPDPKGPNHIAEGSILHSCGVAVKHHKRTSENHWKRNMYTLSDEETGWKITVVFRSGKWYQVVPSSDTTPSASS